jgi:acyl-CoA reductase-like NAD-dependent aldehyde dehydrogenase
MARAMTDRSVTPLPPLRDAAAHVGGRSIPLGESVELRDPYRGDVATRAAISDAGVVRAAVDSAVEAQRDVAALPVHRRAAVLRRAAELVEQDPQQYASSITRLTGKALKNTLREVRRSAWTLRAAATAIETLEGRVFVSDAAPEGEGLLSMEIRQPVGVVGAVTPFNAPFNLVVHKVAPAFAAGNAIVVKPASQAPLAALDVAALMEAAGAPPGAVNIVPGSRLTVAAMTADERVAMFTLTGGRAAGEAILRAAGLRRVTLELGGNSPNIVHRDAPLESAAAACVSGGFSNTGQSCNSVQRIIVHRDVVEPFTERLVDLIRGLVLGDPMDPATDVGTVIDEASAERIEAWIGEARERGARVLIGGRREGAQIEPTVVTDAPTDTRLVCEEVFGPVVVILPYEQVDEAISQANSTPFGLQAAVFTASLDVATRVARGIRSGGVLVNRSTNFRLDHLPYGGIRSSGIGREGPTHAIEEMTERKFVLVAASDPDATI